jgi:hypothetical protein
VRRHAGSVLGDRIHREFRETQGSHLVGKTIASPEDLATHASVYRNPVFETLRYVFTDDAGRVLGETAVSSRMPSSAGAWPADVPDKPMWVAHWLRNAAPEGATGFWAMHNHPSGDPSPSRADMQMTRRLASLGHGLKLHGHIVLDHDRFAHIDPAGNGRVHTLDRDGADPLRVHGGPIHDRQISVPADAARLGKELFALTPDNSAAIISTDARGQVVSASTLPIGELTGRRGAGLLTQLGKRSGANAQFAVFDSKTLTSDRKDLLKQAMQSGLLTDAIVIDGDKARSLVHEGILFANYFDQVLGRKGKDRTQVVQEDAQQYSQPPGEEMPSRRPGESPQAYAGRVRNKGREAVLEATKIAKLQQKVGRANFRAMLAKFARDSDIADAVFAEHRKIFDAAPAAMNLASIDQWENGRTVGDVDASQFFKMMQEGFDQRIARIQELAPDALQRLIENYFPHIWRDPLKAQKWYQDLVAKRPLEGNKAFLKQRTWGTIKEGMAAGLEPVSTNPVDLVLLKYGQMDKFIAFHEFRADLQKRGWLKEMPAGAPLPDGYARIDDAAFQKSAGLRGYYAVPELIAKDVNNYLAPTLYRFGAWRSLRAFENLLMSAHLGWSMFHAGFTTLDNAILHMDVAGRQMLQGRVVDGLVTLAKSPLSTIWSPIEGHVLNQQWRKIRDADPHTSAILHLLEEGGAHRKMSLTDYNNALVKLARSVRQRAVGGTLREILPAIGEVSSWIIHHWLVPNQKMAARVMLAKFELDRFAERLGKERGDYAGIIDAMHPDVVKQIAGHVVNVVDDRLGQMNYDNQFWNKTAREVAQAVIGAVGWQVGTIRTVTGGLADLPRLWNPEELVAPLDKAGSITDEHLGRVSGRLTYLITLGLVMGGLGALTQYLLTGKGPSERKDYFFPRTGRRNADDSEERLQYPSYWMDHYKLATHPVETAEHKLHPALSLAAEAISNQDYYGVAVRNPNAPWYKQAEQIGEFVAKGFLPISVTQAQKAKANDAGSGRLAASFFGVTNAPASVTRSPFQAFVAEKAIESMPRGARTQEQAEHSERMRAAEDAMRRGGDPEFGDLSEKDQQRARKAAQVNVPELRFHHLSIVDKLHAYDLATPAERERYDLRDIILRSNPSHSAPFQRLPKDQQETLLDRIRELRAAP